MNNTHENCKLVVFSNKAWNAIVCETMRKDPVETGGILLGHILSNGYWIVMEVVPPGLKSIHQRAYFEYDTDYVNYAAYSLSKQYKAELSVLGLWHRHPGSMDVFSGTDDGTNATFAQMNTYGAISGLVNIDPKLRFTLRHVAYPLHYQVVDVEVGDDLIPPQYFELKYSFGESLEPHIPTGNGESPKTCIAEPEHDSSAAPASTSPRKGGGGGFVDGKSEVNIKKIRRWAPVAIASVLFLCLGLCIGGAKDRSDDGKTEASESSSKKAGISRDIANTPDSLPSTVQQNKEK